MARSASMQDTHGYHKTDWAGNFVPRSGEVMLKQQQKFL